MARGRDRAGARCARPTAARGGAFPRGCRRASLVALAVARTATAAMRSTSRQLAALRAGACSESAARFRETRHISALAAPIERSGTLLYRRPDHLEMNVETPRAEQLVIERRHADA